MQTRQGSLTIPERIYKQYSTITMKCQPSEERKMTANNTSTGRPVKFAQLSLTLELAYKAGGPSDDSPKVLAWVVEQLNKTPEFVTVKAVNPTGLLSWPDFLDAPSCAPEHKDYQEVLDQLAKVEHWLTLDRKALIHELLRAEDEKAALCRAVDEHLMRSVQNAEVETTAG